MPERGAAVKEAPEEPQILGLPEPGLGGFASFSPQCKRMAFIGQH